MPTMNGGSEEEVRQQATDLAHQVAVNLETRPDLLTVTGLIKA